MEGYESRIKGLETEIESLKGSFKDAISDIKDIKKALVGNEEFSEDGLIKTVKSNSQNINEIKTQKRVEKAAIVAAGTVIGFILTKGIEIISNIIQGKVPS